MKRLSVVLFRFKFRKIPLKMFYFISASVYLIFCDLYFTLIFSAFFFSFVGFVIWLETDRRQKPYELSQECLWYSSTREIPVYFVFCLSDTLLSWELWLGLPLFFWADILKSLKFAAHISLILKYQFLRSHCKKKIFLKFLHINISTFPFAEWGYHHEHYNEFRRFM